MSATKPWATIPAYGNTYHVNIGMDIVNPVDPVHAPRANTPFGWL